MTINKTVLSEQHRWTTHCRKGKQASRKTEAAILFNKNHCKRSRQIDCPCQTLTKWSSHCSQRTEKSPVPTSKSALSSPAQSHMFCHCSTVQLHVGELIQVTRQTHPNQTESGEQLAELPLNTKCILCWLTRSLVLQALNWPFTEESIFRATAWLLWSPPNNSFWKPVLQPEDYFSALCCNQVRSLQVLFFPPVL